MLTGTNRLKKLCWLICACLLFAGCTGQTLQSTTVEPFRACVNESMGTLDPATGVGATYLSHLYEGLTRLDAGTGAALPGMAKSWKVSEDGLTYTFTLRWAKWSDGKAVTAQDFVYAWQRAILMQKDLINSPFRYIENAANVFSGKMEATKLGVEATAKRKLVVHLSGPNPLFPQICALAAAYPLRQDVVEMDNKWKTDPAFFVGNGPYLLKSFTKDTGMVLVKNKTYHGHGDIIQPAITFTFNLDGKAALDAFTNDKLDFTSVFDESKIADLCTNPCYRTAPSLGTGYLSFSTITKPFDDAKVRQAMSLAIDRTALVKLLPQRGAIPAGSLVGLGFVDAVTGTSFRDVGGEYYKTGKDDFEANVAAAKKLLADAGYSKENPLPTIEYEYNSTALNTMVAKALQAMWHDNLGVDVVISGMDWEYFDVIRSSGLYQVCRQAMAADFFDPMLVLERFVRGNSLNDPCYRNNVYDDLIANAKKTADIAERMDMLHQAENVLLADMVVAPLYYYFNIYFIRTEYQGESCNPMGTWFFGYCNVKAETGKK